MARELRGIVPAALAVLVLAAVAAVAAHVPGARSVRVAPTPTTTPTSDGRATGRIAAAATGVPWWLVVLGIAAVLVVVGPMVWLAVRGLSRRRTAGREPGEGEITRPDSDRLPGADDALTEAADDLRAGGDAREVVIACWVRLEAAAAVAGRGRRPSETATDVARRWLGPGDDDRAAVDELAGLFHEARYSDHPVTEEQRERARLALAALTGTRT